MTIKSPKIPKQLLEVGDFTSYAEDFLPDERPMSSVKLTSERIEGRALNGLEIRESILENCVFSGCDFENAGFIDTLFDSCDFSNSRFTGAYFERCRFTGCKCVGANMRGAVFKHTVFESSNFRYTALDEVKMTDIFAEVTDFTEASISESELKRFEAKSSKFIKNNFFKTMLAAVDFSENEFEMPVVSSPPVELKGVVVNMYQAASLARLWGVVIKQS